LENGEVNNTLSSELTELRNALRDRDNLIAQLTLDLDERRIHNEAMRNLSPGKQISLKSDEEIVDGDVVSKK